jgi:hypothetical protein
MKIGRLLAIAGLTYALGSVARAIYEDFGTAVFLTGIVVILSLVFGLFDWTHYDDVIRFALGLIGLVCFAGIIGLLTAGHFGAAFAAAIFLTIVVELLQPAVGGFLAWWDTPERRFGQRMEQSCSYEYVYSPRDGYCHFDHEHYEDLLKTENPNGHGYVERKVPSNWTDTGPAEGALENIQRLKEQAAAAASAPPPHGFIASLAKRYRTHWWAWWIGVPAIIWWVVKKLLGTPRQPLSDPDVKQQIARFHRPGFKDPREKEIERRMRDYLAGRTTKF